MSSSVSRAKKAVAPRRGRPPVSVPKRRVVSFRCSDPFGKWFDGLAEFTRIPPGSVVELALIEWGKSHGYTVAPPKR